MAKRKRSEQGRAKSLAVADQVLALINKSPAPDFLTDAMMAALRQAATVKKINLWKGSANDLEKWTQTRWRSYSPSRECCHCMK